jgi:hypothetical protein
MTITLTREEAKQVLDALNDVRYRIEFGQMNLSDDTDAAIETLRTRLAQPEWGEDYRAMYLKVRDELAELQQREWQGLTEDEAQYLFRLCLGRTYDDFWRDIEAKLKEKNA